MSSFQGTLLILLFFMCLCFDILNTLPLSFLGKTIVPKAVNEVKLISSGKILENNKTVGQCKVPFGDVPGGFIIMHVVVQPSLAKTKTGIFRLISTGSHSICMILPSLPSMAGSVTHE